MDKTEDARRILTAVPQSDWKRLAGRPHTSWLVTTKNDLSYISQPQHGRRRRAGTGQATLEVVCSKRNCALIIIIIIIIIIRFI